MQATRAGHSTQHVHLGMVSSLAGPQFWPDVVKVLETVDQGTVGVLFGDTHVPTQFSGMVKNSDTRIPELLANNRVGGPPKSLPPINGQVQVTCKLLNQL